MMKKVLLLSVLSLMAASVVANVRVTRPANLPEQEASQTRASQELVFRYNDAPEEAYNMVEATLGVSRVYAAVKMRHEELVKYVGNSITAIVVTSGVYKTDASNPVKDIEVFITKDLNEVPVRTQSATLTDDPWSQNRITLNSPYDITADDDVLYIGYSFQCPTSKDACYFVSDNSNDCATNQIVGISNNGKLPTTWQETGLIDGNLCLGWAIKGNNMPKNTAVILNSVFPDFVQSGTNGKYTLLLKNIGTNDVRNYELSTQIGDAEPNVQQCDLEYPISSMTTVRHYISDVPFNGEGFVPVKISLTKINGKEVENPLVYTTEALTYSNGYDRNVLVEEYSGPTCGWCPAGYVLVDYANTKYPGRMIAAIGMLNCDLICADYQDFVDRNVPSIPMTWFNRVSSDIPAQIGGGAAYTYSLVDNQYNNNCQNPAYCQISVTATRNTDTNQIDVESDTEFSIDMDRPHRVSFILTEDGCGPLRQFNNYAGGAYGDMAGWENEADQIEYTYDNVIRACNTFNGIEGSLPATITKGEKMHYTTTLPLTNVNGGALKVIAIVTNTLTGEVMNATRVDVQQAGVETIGSDSGIRVYAADGTIRVEGASDIRIYDMAGNRMDRASRLGNGIYVVIADGKSFKVAMK